MSSLTSALASRIEDTNVICVLVNISVRRGIVVALHKLMSVGLPRLTERRSAIIEPIVKGLIRAVELSVTKKFTLVNIRTTKGNMTGTVGIHPYLHFFDFLKVVFILFSLFFSTTCERERESERAK